MASFPPKFVGAMRTWLGRRVATERRPSAGVLDFQKEEAQVRLGAADALVGIDDRDAELLRDGDVVVEIAVAAPADTGGAPLVRYEVQVLDVANQQVGALWTAGPTATQLPP